MKLNLRSLLYLAVEDKNVVEYITKSFFTCYCCNCLNNWFNKVDNKFITDLPLDILEIKDILRNLARIVKGRTKIMLIDKNKNIVRNFYLYPKKVIN